MKDNIILEIYVKKFFVFIFEKNLNNSIYYLKFDVMKMKEIGIILCWRDV